MATRITPASKTCILHCIYNEFIKLYAIETIVSYQYPVLIDLKEIISSEKLNLNQGSDYFEKKNHNQITKCLMIFIPCLQEKFRKIQVKLRMSQSNY